MPQDYYDEAWRAVRRQVLDRDGHRCVECETSENLHVHHYIPRNLGGSDEPANLITLCASCHAARHPTLQTKLSRRLIERWAIRVSRLIGQSRLLPEKSEEISSALRALGLNKLREGQLDVILSALRGESALIIRPTGSGKSLCFQIPTLLEDGTSMVITPTKALMQDQISGLQRKKIPATFINSDIDPDEKERRYELFENGLLKFMYVAPERFDGRMIRDQSDVTRLLQRRPPFLVIDEAHCVELWGRDFRPSYQQLGDVRKRLGDPPVLAFTATAGKDMQKRLCQTLGIPEARVLISGVDRPNIALVRLPARGDAARAFIIRGLIESAKKNEGKVMIFVPTRKEGEKAQKELQAQGLEIPFYYGRLQQRERDALEGRFSGRLGPELDALICTKAFGMGIDIPNIRVAVHWMQPASIEDYVQEFGRAGRDGELSLAVCFQDSQAKSLHEFMADRTVEAADLKSHERDMTRRIRYKDIESLDYLVHEHRGCFRKALLEHFGASQERRPWVLRLLDWFLGERQNIRRTQVCCDGCNHDLASRVFNHPEQVFHLLSR